MPTTISFDDLPDGLLLKLGKSNSEAYEVECERCKGTGIITGDPITSLTMRARCPDCNGTGKVRKRVEGAVEVTITSDGIGASGHIIHSMMVVENTNAKLCSLAWFKQELTDKLIAAFRDGTLPKKVRDGLQEITIGENQ